MFEKEYLMLPGPTPVPPRLLRALSEPLINHRGPSFKRLIDEVTEGIRYAYQTKNDVLILPSSGTGGMEAAIVNFLSPGDKVLALSIGAFGDRFATIAQTYGCIVDKVDFEWGTAVDLNVVKAKLAADVNKEYKAILVTHNETSTGVCNDLKGLSEIRGDHPALILVDSVSGLGVMEVKTDEWGLDVIVTAAQKGFMIPPGVAFVSVSPRAWAAYEKSTAPKFYWDLGSAKKFLEKGQTPVTPAIPQLTGLREALQLFREKGREAVFAKQRYLRDITRAGVKALGLKLLADDAVASAAVTAVWAPEGIEAKAINKRMREAHNVVLAGGQKKLENKIFRIGHLGYGQHLDVLATVAALEMTLKELGYPVELGAGVKAAQEVIMSRKGLL
ncbi:soluble hydrogenase, small (42 kd) subunit, putative [Heliomicrobium modesticaldum Ice1]|uniref:Soluble hydrogenase, small (42 kd) subunit, putative n=1 Tax=Heliobacterium modesticaldum (strain ATCC 51547 / Ice1) TaxID=498761 RepID=B0TAQ7_HELMI|nr:alanine--glyoxylate aminotransferase family protein [Heliomicrobium modesticaldum]ABZ83709.1 soluble hydrogenase, small (42 kd) subunit, putative [Heliomicrobium modesticaldum Ice1]